jgi:cob(I)alamin adenosyltransferase
MEIYILIGLNAVVLIYLLYTNFTKEETIRIIEQNSIKRIDKAIEESTIEIKKQLEGFGTSSEQFLKDYKEQYKVSLQETDNKLIQVYTSLSNIEERLKTYEMSLKRDLNEKDELIKKLEGMIKQRDKKIQRLKNGI